MNVLTLASLVPADAADDAREKAKEILAQARFTKAPTTTTTSFQAPDIPSPDIHVGGGEWLGALAWILIAGVAIAALVFLVIALSKMDFHKKKKKPDSAGAPELQIPRTELGAMEEERDIDVLLAAAAVALAEGNPTLAIRLRFRAGLLQLDDLGRLEFLPTLTTRAVDRAIASPTFREIGITFDRSAYGERPASVEDFEDSDQAWTSLLKEPVRT